MHLSTFNHSLSLSDYRKATWYLWSTCRRRRSLCGGGASGASRWASSPASASRSSPQQTQKRAASITLVSQVQHHHINTLQSKWILSKVAWAWFSSMQPLTPFSWRAEYTTLTIEVFHSYSRLSELAQPEVAHVTCESNLCSTRPGKFKLMTSTHARQIGTIRLHIFT